MRGFLFLFVCCFCWLLLSAPSVEARGHGGGRGGRGLFRGVAGRVLHPFQRLKDRRAERGGGACAAGGCR
jgi:hypothetical protein